MADQISIRKKHSSAKRQALAKRLEQEISAWTDPEALAKKICVYTTGSFGRSDASEHSDLDVFVVSQVEEMLDKRLLSGLEEIELLSSIVRANRSMGLPELDADGDFLKAHTLSHYLSGLGKPDDDKNNTFTGRLLLLLESQPLFGCEVFRQSKEECIHRYWTDFSDHSETFIPAFLMNDILRFWRTLCINYESGLGAKVDIDPAKRRAKNLKLKHSRMLTCFSAIIGFQVELARNGSVSPAQALHISDISPLDRLELASTMGGSCPLIVDTIKQRYADFLEETNCSKEDLQEKMSDAAYYKTSLESARSFGDEIFKLMQALSEGQEVGSKGWRFLRYVTV